MKNKTKQNNLFIKTKKSHFSRFFCVFVYLPHSLGRKSPAQYKQLYTFALDRNLTVPVILCHESLFSQLRQSYFDAMQFIRLQCARMGYLTMVGSIASRSALVLQQFPFLEKSFAIWFVSDNTTYC